MKKLLLSVTWILCLSVHTEAETRPNIVILLADDAGWGDYSHSGNTQLRTPNIDSIANDGVSLDRFFVCPVCSPTRAEFLTGRYYPRCGVRGVSTGQERLNLDEKTIADAFQSAGYATGAFGKWHNGSQWPYHPTGRGFDEYFGHSSGHWGEYFDAPLEENGRMVHTQGYIVDVCTDRAMQFIDRTVNKNLVKKINSPFLCYVPFTTPHSPWAAPPEDWKRFQNKAITQLASEPSKEVIDETRCALAMLENQDMNVGRILAKLKELNIEDNTIVVYFSDNGPNTMRWTGGMKGKKGSTDEGGVRSVCYIRWPLKITAGRVVTQICGTIDLLPTLINLAGVKRVGDKPLDGRDLSPLLLDHETEWPDRTIFSAWDEKVSARTQRYRLDSAGKLYDMVADPGQRIPINTNEPALTKKLIESVEVWRQDVYSDPNAKDTRPIPVGYPEFPITMLPARDGEPRGQIRRSSSAPNCSYFVNWTKPSDSMIWLVDVHTAGRYEVSIDYTCKLSDVGATIAIVLGNVNLVAKVASGWDPPLNTNQDTLPRPEAESQMKDFRTLALGEINLPVGQGPLTLHAIDVPGQSVMDVRRITLTLVP